MPFFCSCHICKINSKDGNGRVLFTKKTFRKHQKKENASIKKINEIETTEVKGSNKSISSCNISEKRKFKEDELRESSKSDINSDNDILFSIPLILGNRSIR